MTLDPDGGLPLLARVHEEGGGGEDEEDDPAHQGDCPDGDALGDHAPAHDGQAGAEGVAEDAGHDHALDLLARGQDDGGQLRAVAPLSQEGHRER